MSDKATVPSWLPDNFTINESGRSQRIKLRITMLGEMEVTIPKGFNRQRLIYLLEQKRAWIERTMRRIKKQIPRVDKKSAEFPPVSIIFPAIGESWKVSYASSGCSPVRIQEKKGQLLAVSCSTDDHAKCKAALRKWMLRKAHLRLVPLLKKMSRMYRLPFRKALVKGQKTRWGSCSQKKTISINYKLLFLPAHLATYVFLHELCHTVHLNHSRRYWDMMKSIEPDYKSLDRQLSGAWYYVPLWMYRD